MYFTSQELYYNHNRITNITFTTFCTDAYGCQLWNFESREVPNFYVAWRKVVRKLWRLPYITHCNLLHTINNSLPIQI